MVRSNRIEVLSELSFCLIFLSDLVVNCFFFNHFHMQIALGSQQFFCAKFSQPGDDTPPLTLKIMNFVDFLECKIHCFLVSGKNHHVFHIKN
jgi:hypothetical protein